jgi:hypothetical protein
VPVFLKLCLTGARVETYYYRQAKEEDMRRGVRNPVSWGLVVALLVFTSPLVLKSQTPAKGHLVGFVFDKDGSTPVAGAVVMVRDVSNGTVFQSTRTDGLGAFKIEDLRAGIYALGVTSAQGNYNSQELIGIKPGETAKISVALDPYDRDAVEAAQAVAKEEKERGESRVGKVVAYNPQTKEAQVVVERGLLQVGDRIRVKGSVTDFAQDLKALMVEGAKVKRCLTGQNALLPVSRSCSAGDNVYVVCKRGVPPFFLAPLGLAAVVAGSASLVTIQEEEPVTPTRPTQIKH